MIEANKQVVIRFNKEFLEGGNVAVLEEIVDDDFTNHTAPASLPKGASGLIQFMEMIQKAFLI